MLKNVKFIITILFIIVLLFIILKQKDFIENQILKLVKKHPYVVDLMIEKAKLEKELQSKIAVSEGKVKIIYRDATGEAKKLNVDIPPEGKVTIVTLSSGTLPSSNIIDNITTEKYSIENTSQVVIVKIMGFTFKPQFSIYISENIKMNLNFRVFYYKRFGLSIGAYPNQAISIDRRIDDLIPFLRNTTLGIYTSLQGGMGVNLSVFL